MAKNKQTKITKQTQTQTHLRDWIDELGVNEVAGLLRVERTTVRFWKRGVVLPSNPLMFKIRELSHGSVDFNRTIDEHFAKTNDCRLVK